MFLKKWELLMLEFCRTRDGTTVNFKKRISIKVCLNFEEQRCLFYQVASLFAVNLNHSLWKKELYVTYFNVPKPCFSNSNKPTWFCQIWPDPGFPYFKELIANQSTIWRNKYLKCVFPEKPIFIKSENE